MSSCNDDCPNCAELIATPIATHANADCDSVHACGHGTALTQGPKRTKQAISHTGHEAARAGSLPLQAQHTAPEGSPSWQPLISAMPGRLRGCPRSPQRHGHRTQAIRPPRCCRRARRLAAQPPSLAPRPSQVSESERSLAYMWRNQSTVSPHRRTMHLNPSSRTKNRKIAPPPNISSRLELIPGA